MNYENENFIIEYLENPLRISEKDSLEYLRRVFEWHFSLTPYWQKTARKLAVNLDDVFQGNIKEVFENVLNSGLIVEEEYLRANWLEFIPKNYGGKIRFYQSSGTTRERAIGHWDRAYLNVLHSYLKNGLDELYGLGDHYSNGHQMRAIAHGPYGWFQDEISELVWSYGGVLYFIGMETEGLKKIYELQGIEAVLKALDPLVRYTQRVMEKDSINTVRSAPPLMGLFEPYAETIETVILSGVGITHELFSALSETFENATLIPLYGYYLFGDLIGLREGQQFWYYPNRPFTTIFPVKKTKEGYKVVKYHEEGEVGLIIARPEVLVIKIENERAVRVPGAGPFEWDGFGDPHRTVG